MASLIMETMCSLSKDLFPSPEPPAFNTPLPTNLKHVLCKISQFMTGSMKIFKSDLRRGCRSNRGKFKDEPIFTIGKVISW